MGPIICRVKKKSEVMKVTTSKGEQLSKCFIVLKEFGNDYTDEFACSVLGNLADVGFEENELVVARLRFKANEVNGKIYQDVDAIDIKKLK
jgi:hypothetical protein